MTCDEIRVKSFDKMLVVLNEVFPNIQSSQEGNTITFDNGSTRVEMSGNDNYDGYFEVFNEDSCLGTLWGVKDVVSVLIPEICKIRKQKVLKSLR